MYFKSNRNQDETLWRRLLPLQVKNILYTSYIVCLCVLAIMLKSSSWRCKQIAVHETLSVFDNLQGFKSPQ